MTSMPNKSDEIRSRYTADSRLIEYPEIEQGSEQWHEVRRGIVTASTVGKLITPSLRVADNDTSRGVTATLVAERITGHTEETSTTPDMWRGIENEPRARDLYSKTYGPVTETGFMVRDDWGFKIGYSPDGLVGDDGLIEVKSPRSKTHLKTILADQVPAQYMAQLQTGLLVSGRQWIDFISYSGGMPMWHKRVEPDARWHAAIVAAVGTFEANAMKIARTYWKAVKGLPETEYIPTGMEIEF